MLLHDFTVILLSVSISLIVLCFRNYIRSVFLALKTPGPPALPILGNALLIKNSKALEDLGTHFSERYGPVTRVWLSILPIFIITEPHHLQKVIGSNASIKSMFYRIMHNFLGEGLITNNGHKWKTDRKVLQPYFHTNALTIFFNSFNEHANILTERLKGKVDVNIASYINKCVLNILHKTVLDISDEDEIQHSPFRKGKVSVQDRITRPWLLFETIFNFTNLAAAELSQKKKLQKYVKDILKVKRNEMQQFKTKDNASLLEIMILLADNNPEFTEDDIINEACTFMLAGQDSVGAALVFSLYHLGKYPDAQEKVFQELKSIFGDQINRKTTFEDLSEMVYLEQCIKEAMRLCPSVPILSRKLTKDVVLGEHTLPKGANILISPFTTHRLPHIYSEPLEFKPERFSEENMKNIPPYGFIPFSAGPRNCMGYKFAILEMKMILSEIIRKFEISLTPGHENLNLSYRITLRAKGGVWLRLKNRN